MKALNDLKFALIHNHTSYSDGWGTVTKNIEQAVRHHHDGIGVMEHGTCSSLVEHWEVCTEHNVTPILGCELYIRLPQAWQEVGPSRNSRSGRYHISVVTTNFEGYKRLIKLNNAAHQNMEETKGKKYPIATLDMLQEYAGNGLVVLTGCVASVTFHNHIEVAEEYINFLTQTFGKPNVYAEIMPHIISRQDGQEFNGFDRPLQLANKFGLKTIYTTDAHAPRQEDLPLLRDYTKAKSGYEFTASFIQSKEDAFRDAKNVIGKDNAIKAFEGIDDLVNRIEPVNFKRPFKLPHAAAEVVKMLETVQAEFKRDLTETVGKVTHDGVLITEELLQARLKQESDLLEKYKFYDYFAVLWDILRIGHERGITTVARGSASGSYILYLLKVTQLHPVVHGLMFERFLAELRLETGELPDVDVDIPEDDRHYIQEYAKERWGFEPVGTVHIYGHSSTVRMIDRVYSSVTGEEIPDNIVAEASDVGEESPEAMKKFFSYAPWMKEMYDGLLGSVEKFGTHACAVVPTDEEMPVPMESWGTQTVVNYSESGTKKTLQTLGFVKYDLLSSANLALLETLKRKTGVHPPKEIPDNDPCFQVFMREDLTGIFQFDTRVARNLVRLMVMNGRKINSIRVLSDLTSLGRPGPLQQKYHVIYAERSADTSVHPEVVRMVFDQTNGVLVYQEQVAELFARIAFKEYDKTAKEYGIVALKNLVPKNQKVAATEKFKKGYEKLHTMFVKGGMEIHGLDKEYLEELFLSLEGFVRYGFNLSHSLSYANISAQEAWYKYYYPSAFWSTILDSVSNNAKDRGKLLRYIVDATLKSGLKFKPPHINTASVTYSLLDDNVTVQCPISMIKGLGPTMVKEVIDNQPFASLEDVNKRTRLNKSLKLAMYNAGMLDGLPGTLYDLGVCDIVEYKVKGDAGDKSGIVQSVKEELNHTIVQIDGVEYKILEEHSDELKKLAKSRKIKLCTDAKYLKEGVEILFSEYEGVILTYKRSKYYEPLPQQVTRVQGVKDALGFAIPEKPGLKYYFDFAAANDNKAVGYIVEIEEAKTKTLTQTKITLQDGRRYWFVIEDRNDNGFVIKKSKIRSKDQIAHLKIGDLIGMTLVMEKRDGEIRSNGQVYDFKIVA